MSAEVRQEVFVRCSIEHAFEVFTRAVDGWWPPSHRRLTEGAVVLEPCGPGGVLREVAGDQALDIGFVTDWAPPQRIQLGWHLGAPAGFHTRVTITFTEQAEGTLVQVVHIDGDPPIPSWEKPARIFVSAWQHVLAAFAKHESGEGPGGDSP